MTQPRPPIDLNKSAQFMEKVLEDLAAAASVTCLFIGEKLGLFAALARKGPLNSVELAAETNTSERYLREWLIQQAAAGYLVYDVATSRYSIAHDHLPVLADEKGPMYVAGGAQTAVAMIKAEERITELFRTGKGMAWGEHHSDLFEGVGRFFRAGYKMNLVAKWIPLFEGLQEKLTRGALVADVGCGLGISTVEMARAFPNSRFVGFDSHGPSVERARENANQEGVSGNLEFAVSTATDYPDRQYDVIAFFNTLHDIGNAIEATRHARRVLKDDGTILIVEPNAGDRVEDNLNLVGRIFAGSSVLCCTPHAVVAGGNEALGTIPPDEKLRQVLAAGGFTRFRRVTQTKFNRILEARP
jgi:2-polyprenyl-3-methyl-5-hydroxy-6-metoxy-1,4-benzoquinol methylase